MTCPGRSSAYPKILLVDDKPGNLLALEAVIGESSYTLIRASSGAEALAKLADAPDVTLVLLDVEMPGMDGLEVCRRIKATPAIQDIPVIFITATYTEDPFIKKGYQLGAVDYFGKPFDPEILRLKVKLYTSFRQKELLLRENEEKVRMLTDLLTTGRRLKGMPEGNSIGVIVSDAEGRICQTNDEVRRILRFDEGSGAPWNESVLGWWDPEGNLLENQGGPLHRTLSNGAATSPELVHVTCADHSTRQVYVSTCRLSPHRGKADPGAIVILQDVTTQCSIQARMESQIVELVAAETRT